MPWSVTIRRTFCAAHRLKLADGHDEPNHGHNWHVRLTVSRDDGGLDAIGCVVDFHDLQKRLDAVIGSWDTADLNQQAPFCHGTNPSAEHVAQAIGQAIQLPDGIVIDAVEVTEAEGCSTTWQPG